MDTTPLDEAERARAAVAVACLAWLRSSGPAGPTVEAPRRDGPIAIRPPTMVLDLSNDHPLWGRWIDG